MRKTYYIYPQLYWILFFVMWICIVPACVREPTVTETVLSTGQCIDARNKFGHVRIGYVSPIRRRFEWDGRSRVIKMTPRPERFLGMLGMYDPADSLGINPFEIRLVVEESIRDFRTPQEITAFLRTSSAVMDWVFTADGLVVGFGRSPERRQINIDVWQILLNGRKPVGLNGARPESIRLISDCKG